MPKFNDTKLASGAADSCVKVIDLSQETTIESYFCHKSRVKRLAVSQNDPYLLWSCSEDGTIRQFDIRQSANVRWEILYLCVTPLMCRAACAATEHLSGQQRAHQS